MHWGLVGVWLGTALATAPLLTIMAITWLRRVRAASAGQRRPELVAG